MAERRKSQLEEPAPKPSLTLRRSLVSICPSNNPNCSKIYNVPTSPSEPSLKCFSIDDLRGHGSAAPTRWGQFARPMTKNKSSKSTISILLCKLLISANALSRVLLLLETCLESWPSGLRASLYPYTGKSKPSQSENVPIPFSVYFFSISSHFPISFLLLHSQLSRWTQCGQSSGPRLDLAYGSLEGACMHSRKTLDANVWILAKTIKNHLLRFPQRQRQRQGPSGT